MARVYGNTLPTFTFKNGASSAVDLGTYVVSYEVADGSANNVTMSDWQAGNAPKAMNVTFVLDYAATGAFEYLWANKGATNVFITWIEDSSVIASQSNPRVTGTAVLPLGLPNYSVAAGDAVTPLTFDVTVQFPAGLVKAIV